MPEAGIVIVTYNSAAHIGACLEAARGADAPVVVVDNASSDETREIVQAHTGVRMIANTRNLGFAAAINQGVRALDAEFVLALNPDARLETGIKPLVEACRAPGVAAAAGLLVSPDGQAQAGFTVRRLPTAATLIFETLGLNRLWPGNPVNRRYRMAGFDHAAAADVEQPAGALLLFRRDAWERLGGFDEQFRPAWFEDVDFCLRLRQAGLCIRYVPAVRAVHAGGHSVGQLPRREARAAWFGNLRRYSRKHFRLAGRLALECAIRLRELAGR
jgi:GT2 family glycosyltransferase